MPAADPFTLTVLCPLAAAVAFGLAFALGAAGRSGPARSLVGLGAGLAAVAGAAMALDQGRPPLHGGWEEMVGVAVILGLAQLATPGEPGRRLLPWSAALACLGLIWIAILDRGPSPDFYLYADPWVRSFFICRVASLGIMLHAALCACAAKDNGPLMNRARRWLLAGAAVFLAGELSGSLWALRWLGDLWRWSGTFFTSALLFMLAMLVFHLPPALNRRRGLARLCAAAPGVLMLVFTVWEEMAGMR